MIARSTTHNTSTDLGHLIHRLEKYGLIQSVHGDTEGIEIAGVTDDSRRVNAGALFVAIEGETHDGHRYIPASFDEGASAVICTRLPETVPTRSRNKFGMTRSGDRPIIQVTDARRALGIVSHAFWGDPSSKVRMVGVTGTNGKTTTTWLVHHILTQVGRAAGLIGTIECRIGSTRTKALLTTPAAPELNEALSGMVDAGCSEVVMEVSSHALAQERVAGISFSVGVFTNLTRDHLDYHGTWTSYLDAKRSLFTGLSADATAIVNADDPASDRFTEVTKAQCVSFGTAGNSTHRFEIVDNRVDGLRVTIDGDTRRYRLVGAFNAYNLTAAYSVGVALGISETEVLDALETADPVPGRLERFTFDSGVTVIVDYAHTPDALENALTAVKDIAPADATIWCIFGCGGDRDPGKRPEMGSIAEAYADRVVVTSDNPRNEAPDAILGDIEKGMERPEEAVWIADRREAIRFAGRSVASRDVVLVAGKGHEPYQIIGSNRVHFDDREEVMRWFG